MQQATCPAAASLSAPARNWRSLGLRPSVDPMIEVPPDADAGEKLSLRERAAAAFARLKRQPEPAGERDPRLPVTAQVVAVQHPSVSVSERPYDLILLSAVLALLGIGTIAIFSSTAAESLAAHRNPWHVLERQLAFLAVG